MRESSGITKINFELRVEGFLIAVLPRATCTTHGLSNAEEFTQQSHIVGGVFTASITVQNIGGRMFVDAGEERVVDERSSMIGKDAETDDASRKQIHHRTEEECRILPIDMGEVCDPDMVRVLWLCGKQQILHHVFWLHRGLSPLFPSPAVWLNAIELHDSAYPLLVHFQMQGKSPMSVARMLVQHFLNLTFEMPVLLRLLWHVVQAGP